MPDATDSGESIERETNRLTWAGATAWGTVLTITALDVAERWRPSPTNAGVLDRVWSSLHLDEKWMLLILLIAPACWLLRVKRDLHQGKDCDGGAGPSKGCAGCGRIPRGVRQWALATLVGLVSLTTSLAAASRPNSARDDAPIFSDLVPTVHDEFSYLLQARTMLAGRWFWPGPERAPELFHQMHVLNEGKFASRYPPGTGAWIVPWLWIDRPVWGERLAGMILAAGVFWMGSHVAGLGTGLTAGLLTALAPNLAIFSNLILSHGPTLVGMPLFLIGFFRWMDTLESRWAWLAGAGLAEAMLCRPLTAAAMGFPFGAWLVSRSHCSFRENLPGSQRKWRNGALGLGVPLVVGLAILGWQNVELTGDVWTTPYSLYTRLYTPRHAYGFGNGNRMAEQSTEKILADYNNWPKNLDWQLAVRNLWGRLRSSWKWTLGFVPLALAGVTFVLTFPHQPLKLRPIFASIVSLHVAYLPYWLDGMLGHHYVLESAPLWLVIFAATSSRYLTIAFQSGRWLFPGWWGALVFAAVWTNHSPWLPGGALPRTVVGIKSITWPSEPYRQFQKTVADSGIETPTLILVQPSPTDLHVEFVRNVPPFDAEVLVARDRPELHSHETVAQLFPDRAVYLYDSQRRTLQRWRGP